MKQGKLTSQSPNSELKQPEVESLPLLFYWLTEIPRALPLFN
jgi:hypothetical protein